MTTNNNNNNAPVVPALSDEVRADMAKDAANARAAGRLSEALAPAWDAIYAANVNGKRADVVRAVLEVAGLWRETPQTERVPVLDADGAPVLDADGEVRTRKIRTPFGNVVQRFAAQWDEAVKRANGDDDAPKPVILRATLSGEGGGSVTIPADHPLYGAIVDMINGGE